MARATSTKTRKPTAAQERKAAEKAAWREQTTAMLREAEESFEYDEDNASMVKAFNSLTTHYSEGNALLILAQADMLGVKVRGLQDVGGFGVWNERGRSIKPGEHKSIYIWGHGNKRDGDSDATVTNAAGVTQNVPGTTTPQTEGKRKDFYFPVGIFHVGQTETKAQADARRAAAK